MPFFLSPNFTRNCLFIKFLPHCACIYTKSIKRFLPLYDRYINGHCSTYIHGFSRKLRFFRPRCMYLQCTYNKKVTIPLTIKTVSTRNFCRMIHAFFANERNFFFFWHMMCITIGVEKPLCKHRNFCIFLNFTLKIYIVWITLAMHWILLLSKAIKTRKQILEIQYPLFVWIANIIDKIFLFLGDKIYLKMVYADYDKNYASNLNLEKKDNKYFSLKITFFMFIK